MYYRQSLLSLQLLVYNQKILSPDILKLNSVDKNQSEKIIITNQYYYQLEPDLLQLQKSIIMQSWPQRNMLFTQKQFKQNSKLTKPKLIRQQSLKISFPLLSQVSLKTNKQNINTCIYKFTAVLLLVCAITMFSQGYIAFLNMLIVLYLSFFIGKLLGAQRVYQQNANTYKNEEEPKSFRDDLADFGSKILYMLLIFPFIHIMQYGVAYLLLLLSFVTAGLALIASTYLRIFLMLFTLALSIASGIIFIWNQQMLQNLKKGKFPENFVKKVE